ncbi:prepilin-type N-terminal cleavage/methylation domain-containing protein [Ureibacillus endophyticus]|uniref:Prepilin-type N-terminal cleavage/methylation domain-containing protein n=1 Tax=Ureibacillus endophyticus TaxID=1978490 RepID=A0A494Z640_9BACL|nr:prepilin-type N-terminal cleavage/methylation domain-containing protein [Lysinibacillus endophyticus]RKQ18038.1 prepilin-type N-terminal cleavage/methylation domain-containing protein [Lysinibacillus endophyticus]
MKYEKGFTLIEVVASILLISILLISFFGVFKNIYKSNAINDNNIVAMNLARYKSAEFTEKGTNSTTDPDAVDLTEFNSDIDPSKSEYCSKEEIEDQFIIKIFIKKMGEGNTDDFYQEPHQVIIVVKNMEDKILSETYTYIYHQGVVSCG